MSEYVGSIQPNDNTKQRPNGVKPFTPERKIPIRLVNAICELRDAGWSRPQVARWFGFKNTTFWRFTKRHGIEGWPWCSAEARAAHATRILSVAAIGNHRSAQARRQRLRGAMTDQEFDLYLLFRRKKFSVEESMAAVMRHIDRSAR